MRSKKIDFIVVCAILVAVSWISFTFGLKALVAGLLYCLLPPAYLWWRKPKNTKKIIWATLILGLFLGFFFEFVQAYNGGWYIPHLTIPIRFLGVAPIDDILAFVIMAFFTLVFYEHFIDDERNNKISKRSKKIFLLTTGASVIVLLLYFIHPASLKVSEVYFKAGLAAVVFPIIYGFRNPAILKKMALVSGFFFFVWLLAEIVGVKMGGWTYPGQYVGWVSAFGVTFPLEEIIFWAAFYSAVIVAFYESYIDDGR